MHFGGKTQFYLKRVKLMALAAMGIVLFQNCGMDAATQDSLFPSSGYSNFRCLSETVDCGADPDYLQISIDMADGQAFASSITSISVTGRCNTGNYENYRIDYKVTDQNATIIDSGSLSGTCGDNGKYNFPLSISAYSTGVLYNLKLTIIGVGSDGLDYENFGSNGSAQVDFSRIP